LIETIEYDVYGLPSVAVEPGKTATGNRYLFTGREWDSETGLYHYRARAYSPSLGRFLQRDPLEALPLYGYVGMRPIIFTDPSGKQEAVLEQGTITIDKEKGEKTILDAVRNTGNWGKGRLRDWAKQITEEGAKNAKREQGQGKTVCCATGIKYKQLDESVSANAAAGGGMDYTNKVTHTYELEGNSLEECKILQSVCVISHHRTTDEWIYKLAIPDDLWTGP
jgi:RHS repeat-associated protein